MARPGLTRHRKFLRLARSVGNVPLALGCLELIWEKCYETGDAYLGDTMDIELAAQWPGEQGVLCNALLQAGGDGNSGFIEEIEDRPGHYRCHDLFDHAPEYVAKRRQREIEREQKGVTLSQIRSEAGRKGAAVSNAKRSANDGKRSANDRQVACTPAPAPAPAPLKSQIKIFCSEPQRAAAAEPAVFTFDNCIGTGPKQYSVTSEQVSGWTKAFPGLDVLSELRKAQVWLQANSTKRKTYRGMPRFIVGWLSREQNRSNGNGNQFKPWSVEEYTRASLERVAADQRRAAENECATGQTDRPAASSSLA